MSLVELMVGMVLGIMLIVGATAIYLASKRSYVEVEQVAALSENARFVQKLVDDSLRHAGFFGEVPANMVDRDPNLTNCGRLRPPRVPRDAPASAHNLGQFVYAAPRAADNKGLVSTTPTCRPAGFVNDVLVIKHVLPRPLLGHSPRHTTPPKTTERSASMDRTSYRPTKPMS